MPKPQNYNHDRMLQVLKLVYRKHCLGDDSIGWAELDSQVLDILCDVMGDQDFQAWLTDIHNDKEDTHEYEVDGLDEVDQGAAERIAEVCQREPAWT